MASSANPLTPSAEGTPSASFVGRLEGILISPAATFRGIARAPDILAPLVTLVAISVIAWEVILHRVGAAQIMRSQLATSGRAANMSPEQIQAAINQGAKYVPMVGRLIALVSVPIAFLVIAAIGLAIMKAIFGQQLSFSTAYSITTYADVPSIIAGVLLIIVVLFGDPATFNVSNPAPTNLGFFLSPETVSKPLYTAATSLNVFSFWFMALLGIGFSEAVQGKVRARTVFLCFLSLWVLWVLIRVGLATL